MKIPLLFITLLTINSFSIAQEEHFSLTGHLDSGIEEGSKFYMLGRNGEWIDSTFVKNSKIQFETDISEFPFLAYIISPDYRLSKGIWLEDRAISFQASKDDFKNSDVTGSSTHDEFEQLHEKVLELDRQNRMDTYLEFAFQNPKSILSAYFLQVYKSNWDIELVKQLYAKLDAALKSTYYAKKIERYIELNHSFQVGDKYFPFELKNNSEIEINSEDIISTKKYTLLEFWGSWCGPCRKSNPSLKEIYDEYNSKGFEIIGVAIDDKESSWKKAILEDKLNWPNLLDEKDDEAYLSLVYGLKKVPYNISIDKQGEIVAMDLKLEELKKFLAEKL